MRLLLLCTAITALGIGAPVIAAGDLTRADVQEVVLTMGTDDAGRMYFEPSEFVFETGQAYKLKLVNIDPIKHEITFGEAGEKMFTRKVEVEDADGEMIVEVKGAVHEVEVGPGRTVDWYFVPVQTIEVAELACELEGHREVGMHGLVTFK